MAYKVIILYRLYMPSYFLGTFTEYPKVIFLQLDIHSHKVEFISAYMKTVNLYSSFITQRGSCGMMIRGL